MVFALIRAETLERSDELLDASLPKPNSQSAEPLIRHPWDVAILRIKERQSQGHHLDKHIHLTIMTRENRADGGGDHEAAQHNTACIL